MKCSVVSFFLLFELISSVSVAEPRGVAKIVLTKDGRLGPEYQFTIPKQYLAPRIAGQLSLRDSATVESLYLILTRNDLPKFESQPGHAPTSTTAPIHLFLRLATQPQQRDSGQWRFERALEDARRRGVAPQGKLMLVDGRQIAVYQLRGALPQTLYRFQSGTRNAVFVDCLGFACRGFRTWNADVVVDYRYPSDWQDRVTEIDAAIEALVASFRDG